MTSIKHWDWPERLVLLLVLAAMVMAIAISLGGVAEAQGWTQEVVDEIDGALTLMIALIFYLVVCTMAEVVDDAFNSFNARNDWPVWVVYFGGAIATPLFGVGGSNQTVAGTVLIGLLLLLKAFVPPARDWLVGRIKTGVSSA